MPGERASRSSENSEEARAFLQTRVALFWKVMFFIMLLASGLSAVGAVINPSVDLILDLALAAQAGAFWWLCRRGQRSVRFSRILEGSGMLLSFTGGSLLGRYVLAAFARDHSLITSEGTMMADGYVSALGLAGNALWVVIRAALIPSSPRRTIFYTAMVGVPTILAPTFLVPTAHGGLAVRALDSGVYPWLPVTLAVVWGFVIITGTVISRVIYGLRAEVREARRLGQYTLQEKIGEGGMGVVYRATHTMLRRPAAIKLLLPDRAGPRDLARFEREVQQTSRLAHPNTISIFDYGRSAEGVFYYVMEYLDGFDLDKLVESDGPLAPARAIHVLAQASGALAEAHAMGLIHRDIKPANIVLTERADESDVVKVVDFGLVKTLDRATDDAAVTNANTITGTPMYLAPEAIASPDEIDARSDLYALGAVGYYLLTGQHVFEGATVMEVCSKHMLETPIAPSKRLGKTLPQDIEALVLACLAKRRQDRPATALVLRDSLLACADGARYDADAGRAWWRERGAVLRARPKSWPTKGHATMAVDLRGRATAHSSSR